MNKYEAWTIAEIQDRAVHTLKTVLSAETAAVAVESMGKQTPKSVMPFNEKNLDTKICPCCKNICAYWEENYCVYCGQRLEW